jgi:hypothetical protein
MKKTNRVKLFLALGTLMVMTASPNYANAVRDAQFSGSLYFSPGGTGWVEKTNQAGNLSLIITQPDYSYNGSVQLSGGSHPTVNLSVSQVSSGPPFYLWNQSSGQITYYVRVNKRKADAPDVDYLPLLGSSTGSMVASPGPMGVAIQAKLGGSYIINQNIYDSGPWTGSNTIKVYVSVHTGLVSDFEVYIYAACSGSSNPGSCQAIIAPKIQIDPTWMVSYLGQNVPGSELYYLTYSNGFAPVSLPSAVLYLLLE